jgi:hypothetical protein
VRLDIGSCIDPILSCLDLACSLITHPRTHYIGSYNEEIAISPMKYLEIIVHIFELLDGMYIEPAKAVHFDNLQPFSK